MRNTLDLFLPLIVISILMSCESLKGEDPSVSHLGKWELEESLNSWFPDTTPVSELGYSETYDFRSNGTFTKTNSKFDRLLTGTYEITPAEKEFEASFQSSLTLTYNASDLEGLPTNESGNVYWNDDPFFWIIYGTKDSEVVFLHKDGTLTNPGYGWADGPVYVYNKK